MMGVEVVMPVQWDLKKNDVCMSSKEFIMWVMPMGINLHLASCI